MYVRVLITMNIIESHTLKIRKLIQNYFITYIQFTGYLILKTANPFFVS